MLAAARDALSHMLGGTSALMVRALRVEQRLLRTYLVRLVFVLTLYAILVMSQGTSSAFGAPGLMVFWLIIRINFIFITLAACSWFCTSITEEKEEMTLGLLMMAGVNPIAIILGKHVPRLVSALLLLSAQFPFVLLAITLGGVTMPQVLAAFVALLAYMLMVSSLGLVLSVISPRSSSASSRMVVLLFVYFMVPGFANAIITVGVMQGYLTSDDLTVWLVKPVMSAIVQTNIWTALGSTVTTGFADPLITPPVVANVSAGTLFFGLAWLLFGPLTRSEKPATPGRGLLHIRLSPLRRLGTSRAWNFALAWKDFHFMAGGYLMLIVKLLLYAGIVPFIVYLTYRVDRTVRITLEDAGNMLMGIMGVAFFVELTMYASRIFQEEVRWRTLSTLVLLPKSIAEVAYGKMSGCALALLPAVCLFAVGAFLSPRDLADFLTDASGEPGFWYSASCYLFWLHVAVLLSLYVKWGALPLTFALLIVFQMVFMNLLMLTVRGNPDGWFVVLALGQFIACFFLQAWIGLKLQSLAAV